MPTSTKRTMTTLPSRVALMQELAHETVAPAGKKSRGGGDAPPPAPVSGMMRIPFPTSLPSSAANETRVPTARPRPSQAVAAAAADRMQDILERKRGGGGGDFARQVAEEARRRRGGAPGDVVPLGKRKQPEPNMPRSILRKRAAPPTPQRQRTGNASSTPQLFTLT